LSFKPSQFNTPIADDADIGGNNSARAMKVRILTLSLPPNVAPQEQPAKAVSLKGLVMINFRAYSCILYILLV